MEEFFKDVPHQPARATRTLREVTFWQAVGILALSRILFGGFGMGGGGRDRSRRWDRNMSAEERLRFRQRMRDRCGVGPETPENHPTVS